MLKSEIENDILNLCVLNNKRPFACENVKEMFMIYLLQ